MGGASDAYGKKRNAYNILVGKPEWKRPTERPNYRWMILKLFFKNSMEGANWVHLVYNKKNGRLLWLW
jgi:hypothetical protein